MKDLAPMLAVLGNNIRKRRRAADLTQAELAERADLHRTYIADVERGGRNISILNVVRFARAFGISASELCEGLR